MKRFVVEGEFDAEDIDDAFAVLAAHFPGLSQIGLDAGHDNIISMDVHPVEDG